MRPVPIAVCDIIDAAAVIVGKVPAQAEIHDISERGMGRVKTGVEDGDSSPSAVEASEEWVRVEVIDEEANK